MMMMHGVEFNGDKVTGSYPKDKDGHDIAPKGYLEHARNLSARMASFLAERNEKRAVAKARKRSAQVHHLARPLAAQRSLTRLLFSVMDDVVPPRRLWLPFEHCIL
jgi:hypothetical protein